MSIKKLFITTITIYNYNTIYTTLIPSFFPNTPSLINSSSKNN